MFDQKEIQVLILTKDEEPNIVRVLDKLAAFPKIVILDSYSSDNTLSLVKGYSNVHVQQRVFDTHANQWNYGLSLLTAKWVLSLDADYILPADFIAETEMFIQTDNKVACFAQFKFAVFGHPLNSNNTTRRPVLFQLAHCSYFDDGHTQRLLIGEGKTANYKSKIIHDDRKSLSRWLRNQDAYSDKEAAKIVNTCAAELSFNSRVRKNKVFAPFLVFFHCLFIKGLIFSGWRGWHYTLQRTMVETLLALKLIEEEKLKK